MTEADPSITPQAFSVWPAMPQRSRHRLDGLVRYGPAVRSDHAGNATHGS
jgi:hypothetical protein